MNQSIADLQESLDSLTYVATRYLRELDETERLSHGFRGLVRFMWCSIFGHSAPYKHTTQCSRCGL